MSTSFIHAAQSCIGSVHVLTASHDQEPYLQAARYGRGQALAVVRPETTLQISQLVRLAQEFGIRLIPQGSNTSLTLSATPSDAQYDVVLSTARLKEVFQCDPLERTLRVSSGYKLSEINQKLEPHDLFFPIDLSADPSVGGMLACNTGGTRLVRYGDVRHNTLGLSAVLAEPAGEIIEWSNALSKNNVGIDGKHLFIGTSGAFGIITEAVLSLHPLPKQKAVALIAPSSIEAVMLLFQKISTRFHDVLSAFEGMSRNAVILALEHVPNLRTPFPELPDYLLLIELSSTFSPAELSLSEALENFLAEYFETLINDAIVGADESLWQLRHSLSEGLRARGQVIGFDIALKRSDFQHFRLDAEKLLKERLPEIIIADFGHIGDGGMHFNIVWPKELGTLSDTYKMALRDTFYDLVVYSYKGSFSAEHGIGPYLQHHYDRYTPAPIKHFATQLESVFNPKHCLSVTRFGN